MLLPKSWEGKITVAIFVVFTIAMNPPVILLVENPVLVAGISQLYLWTVVWGLFICGVLIWAAWRDAFALTNEHVPPELRDEQMMTTTSNASEESTMGESN